jgi:hypothetical protein
MLGLSAQIFGRIHAEISQRLGATRLEALEGALDTIASERSPKLGDLPGWLR